MKKYFGLMMVAILLSGSANAHAAMSSASAPDRVGHVDWGVGVSAAFNESSDTAPFYSTTLAYGVTPYIALGAEAGWQEADGEAADETVGIVPILADIIIRIPDVHESIVPYGILGLGIGGVYVEDDNGTGPLNNGDDSDDTGFAWKLGAGIDWFINTQWILNFEFAYWDVDVELPGTILDDQTSFWTLGVALKYLF